MAGRLARSVHVRDDMGVPHVFGPDDDVPSWAADKISNPAAWADGVSLPSAPSAPARPAEPAPRRTEVQSTPAAQAAERPNEPPPQRGPGSGTAAWRAYAERNGVQVAPGADRSDIIDTLTARGVRV